MDIRTGFETWCKNGQNLDTKRARKHDGYYWTDIQFAWETWQASRVAVWQLITDEQRVELSDPILAWGARLGHMVVFWDKASEIAPTHNWWHADGNYAYHRDAFTHWQPLYVPPAQP